MVLSDSVAIGKKSFAQGYLSATPGAFQIDSRTIAPPSKNQRSPRSRFPNTQF